MSSTIAIVGIGATLPQAPTAEDFWKHVVQGHAAHEEPPPGRWSLPLEQAYAAGAPQPDRVLGRTGCFVTTPDFALRETPLPSSLHGQLDPSLLVGLHTADQALRDAGLRDRLPTKTDVILGHIALPTERNVQVAQALLLDGLGERLLRDGAPTDREAALAAWTQALQSSFSLPSHTGTGALSAWESNILHARAIASLPAALIAQAFGAEGSTYTLDAACASSLYAIKLACDALESGRCDVALAGGLSRPDHLYTQMGFSQLRALSAKGFCTPFDERADGLSVGEGAAMVVLRRLEDAQREGHTIYGLIRGAGLSNDVGGRLLAPDQEGQLRAMRQAYQQAAWRPEEVDLIECHATGTPVGDAVEYHSLQTLWGDAQHPHRCVLGSAKSNIGHLLTAAGGAGLVKVLLAIKHQIQPPTANFLQPLPRIALEQSPFSILSTARPWETPPGGRPRRAAVSAFGFGGINAHLLIEEYTDTPPMTPSTDSPDTSRASMDTEAQPQVQVTAAHLSEADAAPLAIVGLSAQVGGYRDEQALQRACLGESFQQPLREASWWGLPETNSWARFQGERPLPTRGLFCDAIHLPMQGFRIPPRELEELLPQQVWMLQVADAAIRQARLHPTQHTAPGEHTKETGVYLGVGLDLNTTNYHLRWALPEIIERWQRLAGLDLDTQALPSWLHELTEGLSPALNANRTMGGLASVVASRLAREYRWGGPSFVLADDAGAGLRALEVAAQALRRGEIRQALVGAIDLLSDVRAALLAHQERPFAIDGSPRPFDLEHQGSVPADGAVALVLKRLDDAQADGDTIFGVIRGIGVAGGAHPQEDPAHTQQRQERAHQSSLRQALDATGVTLQDVGYIEHADATDPDDVKSWLQALHSTAEQAPSKPTNKATLPRDLPTPQAVLSATSLHMGWAGAASGLLAVARATWNMHARVLPALPHLPSLAHLPAPSFLASLQEPEAWVHDSILGPRRALVAGNSLDGESFHLLLESAPTTPTTQDDPPAAQSPSRPARAAWSPASHPEKLFVLQGRDPQALYAQLDTLEDTLSLQPSTGHLAEMAQTWQAKQPPSDQEPYAISLLLHPHKDITAQLRRARTLLQQGRDSTMGPQQEDIFFTPEPLGPRGELAFVYPGSGSHYAQMGRELGLYWPEILAQQEQENDFLRTQLHSAAIWRQHPQDPPLDEETLIFGQVTFGALVSDILQHLGLRPQAALGYSLGESTALFSLRAWKDRDEMLRRILRSDLFTQQLAGTCLAARQHWSWPSDRPLSWKLGVASCPAPQLREALHGRERVYLLIVNTPSACVIGGEEEAVDALVRELGCAFVPLEGVTTVHCEVVEPVKEAYRALHHHPVTPPEGIRFYSGRWGRAYTLTSDAAADAILAQALEGLDFPALVQQAYADGVRMFVEIGPGDACSRMIGQILSTEQPYFARAVSLSGQSPPESMLRLLAALHAHRLPGLSNRWPQEVPQPLQVKEAQTVKIPVGRDAPTLPPLTEVLTVTPSPATYTSQTASYDLLNAPWTAGMAPGSPTSAPSPSHVETAPSQEYTRWEHPHQETPLEKRAETSQHHNTETRHEPSTTHQGSRNHRSAPPAEITPRPLSPHALPLQEGIMTSSPPYGPPHAPGDVGLLQKMLALQASEGEAHAAYLHDHQQALSMLTALMQTGPSPQAPFTHPVALTAPPLAEARPPGEVAPNPDHGSSFEAPHTPQASWLASQVPTTPQTPATPQTSTAWSSLPPQIAAARARQDLVMDRDACLIFATGDIGDVWGKAFAFIDQHPTRVRLPDEPLMLVDRVLTLEGEPFSLKKGRIVTEHDVLPGSWYLDSDRLPTCIAVESGQADLMLSAYLGIDRETRGEAVYRLLDAQITFHRGLPRSGEILHHDIRIERFFKHDQTYLFRFAFDSSVDGQKVLTMRQGCAGFFTQEELTDGRGVVLNEQEWGPGQGEIDPRGVFWHAPPPEPPQDQAMAALRQGDLRPAFGEDFARLPLQRPLTLPGGQDPRMKLLDRVISIEPTGGRFGIGRVIAEMDIDPQDWFLTCHFVDDMVMPGTLMYECCLHTMRLYLIGLGWIGETDEMAWEPVPGITSELQCRGQVLQSTRRVRYEIHIKQLGYRPDPFAIADALMYADDRPVVRVREMSLQLSGSSYEALQALWQRQPSRQPIPQDAPSQTTHATWEHPAQPSSFAQEPVLYTRDQILEYAIGAPSRCFGPRYEVFDQERFLARLPNPPYLFMDRVLAVEGTLTEMKAGTRVISAYDIPPDAWYFTADHHALMPFAVLLEIALQPCGWMAAFMGSAFTSEEALHFRNLGGEATVHKLVTPTTGTLQVDVRCSQVAHSGGMIIQHYEMAVEDAQGPVYTGKTYFGFFSAASLAQQVGIRGHKPLIPASWEAEIQTEPFPQHAPFPSTQLRMLDTLIRYPKAADEGGATLLSGIKHVDPADWFFQAHFYQDPVWPGSLGLEAMLQLMKIAAAERWGGPACLDPAQAQPWASAQPFLAMPPGETHRWSYRGQVIPSCERVQVDTRIHRFDDEHKRLWADGLLHVDGRTIYEMKDFCLAWRL